MGRPTRILVFRFSAMGDVAMAAAVLRDFTLQYPDVQLLVVSRPAFRALFQYVPGSRFIALKSNDKHKGLLGLFRLYKELSRLHPDSIVDLHDNLRSRVLSSLFRSSFLPIRRIKKGRIEKKMLTRRNNKHRRPLRSTVDRYADVFRELGFEFEIKQKLQSHQYVLPDSAKVIFAESKLPCIGIAPFAQHATKVYPLPRMESLIEGLATKGYTILLFGGGEREAEISETWTSRFPRAYSLIGKFTLEEELKIISNLSLMVSMDSAGMHMASLMGIPCISIWGATHPNAGFLGYGQRIQDTVQAELYCRPCSVYGNVPCYRGDHACMHLIDAGMIIARIEERLA